VGQFRQEVRQALLDRLSIAYLVSDHVEPEPAWPLIATGRLGGSAFAIHGNPTALPRAYVVPRAEPVADREWTPGRFRNIDPREAVTMAADPLGERGPRQPFTPAEWCSDDPDRVELRVATGAPGLLVVADTWMPGWTATVDGRARPVLPGNHAQRVVPIDRAGRHQIVLRYTAPGLRAGLAGTASSSVLWLAIAIGAALRTYRSRRRRRHDRRALGPETCHGRARAGALRPSRAASAATIPESGAR
jgi:hypothetical protein